MNPRPVPENQSASLDMRSDAPEQPASAGPSSNNVSSGFRSIIPRRKLDLSSHPHPSTAPPAPEDNPPPRPAPVLARRPPLWGQSNARRKGLLGRKVPNPGGS